MELRTISSLDVSEPAVRYMVGWYKGAGSPSRILDCEWDADSNLGYRHGKEAKDALRASMAEQYGVTFAMIKLQEIRNAGT